MAKARTARSPGACLMLLAALAAGGGCSLKTMAVKTVANTLSESGDVFSSDEDPELIRDAVPFALKTYESLLQSVPRHVPLLMATCSGFTQYAYAFVQADADLVDASDYPEAKRLRERALKLYLRGRRYCVRALEERFPGIGPRLLLDPDAALARAERRDVPLLYWSGAAWGASIALGLADPEIAADFPAVRALMDRALALDPDWNRGAIHEALIALDSLPEALGGSPDAARAHFERAVTLQGGRSAGPYVSLALGVSVPAQNRAEFVELLTRALAVDPDADPPNRLANILARRRAAALLARADDLFLK
jgi:predicted anti-sigma-YlaC factor YlaD